MNMHPLSELTGPLLRDVAMHSAKASLLAMAVAVACMAPRRWLSSSWRHVLWCVVFARLVLPDVPVPGWRWSVNRLLAQPVAEAEAQTTGPAGQEEVLQTEPPFVARDIGMRDPSQAAGVPTPVRQEAESASSQQEVATSALAEALPAAPFPWGILLGTLWMAGTAGWWLALAGSWWRFNRRVLAHATETGSGLQALLVSCVDESGVCSNVRMKCTDRICSPAVCGVVRPIILVPTVLRATLPANELRLLILHELGHVKRRDALVQVMASVLLGLHWWNPVLWHAWRRLRHEAEAATDAWVLRRTGSDAGPMYGAMLLGLASRACTAAIPLLLAPSVVGVSSQGRSLRERLTAIMSHRPARRFASAGGVIALLLLSITGFAQTGPALKGPATETIGGMIVDEEGKPISGANVDIHLRTGRPDPTKPGLPGSYAILKRVVTDEKGRWECDGVPLTAVPDTRAAFNERKDAYKLFISHTDFLSLECSTMGPVFGTDAEFRQKAARLTLGRGHVLQGVVRDGSGKGIPGATVQRIVADMPMGKDPAAVTDTNGKYEMKHARPGDFPVLVRAAGYAAQQQRVVMKEARELDFVMRPARTVTVRVRDAKGIPVTRGTVAFSLYGEKTSAGKPAWSESGKDGVVNWKGSVVPASESRLWSVMLDQSGTVTWGEAPHEEIVASVMGTEMLPQSKKVSAGGTVEFTLTPAPTVGTVTLKVKSAETGKPLAGCSVEAGMTARDAPDAARSLWLSAGASTGVAGEIAPGEYRIESRGTVLIPSYLRVFRVRCPGHAPTVTEVVDPAKGDVTIEVSLKPRQTFTITVLNVDGTPAANAKVTVAWSGRPAPEVEPGKQPPLSLFSISSAARRPEFSGVTDERGHCSLPPAADEAGVLVSNEGGYAVGLYSQLMKDGTMRMQAYREGEERYIKLLLPTPGGPGLPGTLRMRLSRGDEPVQDEQAVIFSVEEGSNVPPTAMLAPIRLGVASWSYRPGKRVAQAACRVGDGTYCFGPVTRVEIKSGDTVEVDAPLVPGIRLAGKVSDEVPRPVKDAHVMIFVSPMDKDGPGQLAWNEVKPLREDGTFEFRSLPPGEVRFCVLADGWTSEIKPQKDGGGNDAWPAGVITLAKDDLVIPMHRTAACEVTVVDETGKPIPNATVRMSTAVDVAATRRLQVYSSRRPSFLTPPRSFEDMFSGQWKVLTSEFKNLPRVVTDAEGRAVLEGLPAHAQLGNIIVVPPAIDPKPRKLQEPTPVHKSLQPGETMKITVRIAP